MAGRILNFSEFFDKYSKETSGEKGLADITQAASNFEEGFDDATYKQSEIGPNKPVSADTEMTPPQPGEIGVPKFSSQMDNAMDAPMELPTSQSAEFDEEESEENEEEEESEENEEEEESEESEEESTPEPEANANPKQVKESKFTQVTSFSQYLKESHMPFMTADHHHGHGDPFAEENGEICPNCGHEIMHTAYGTLCGCEEEKGEVCDRCGKEIQYFGASPSCGCNM